MVGAICILLLALTLWAAYLEESIPEVTLKGANARCGDCGQGIIRADDVTCICYGCGGRNRPAIFERD
jgi:hypothetical protein